MNLLPVPNSNSAWSLFSSTKQTHTHVISYTIIYFTNGIVVVVVVDCIVFSLSRNWTYQVHLTSLHLLASTHSQPIISNLVHISFPPWRIDYSPLAECHYYYCCYCCCYYSILCHLLAYEAHSVLSLKRMLNFKGRIGIS